VWQHQLLLLLLLGRRVKALAAVRMRRLRGRRGFRIGLWLF
jgi:hypothetical protein